MEAFLIKLVVAVVPFITLVAIVILYDAHNRKRMLVNCMRKRTRKGVLHAFAAGIMFR